MNKSLTIIIPCYNCESTIVEAVNSCYTQGFSLDEFEIVMVNDASTDTTQEIMEGLARKNKNIRLFSHQENKGGGATRNTAVANSQAEIIFCLDSDDALPEGTLLKMYQFLIEKKCDGVTIHKSIKFSGNNIQNIHHTEIAPRIEEKISITSLLSKNREFCSLYVNFMYTKEAFHATGGYPTNHGYDTQGFAWRFLCAGLNAYICPDATYLHRIHFNESYYLREYNAGKLNYNWRDILLEHYYIFNEQTLHFIYSFDCSDFTRNIIDELPSTTNLFISNYETQFGIEHQPLQIILPARKYIKRNSLQGYYLRIKSNIRSLVKK